MPNISIDIKDTVLAEIGYNASCEAWTDKKMKLPSWNDAPVSVRNYWFTWARIFVQMQMGIKK